MATPSASAEPAAAAPAAAPPRKRRRPRPVRTPTVLQMEAVECGAATLGMILGYYGLFVPLEELRTECGVSRDGSKASNMLRAARKYKLTAKGYKKEPEQLDEMKMPVIVFWNFNHFVVLEGFRKGRAYINDPANGRRSVDEREFDESFTGVILTFAAGPEFKKGGQQGALLPALKRRLRGSKEALLFAVLTGLGLVIPGLLIPTFTRLFVDEVLVAQRQSWMKPLLIGLGLTAVLRALFTYFQQRCLARLQTKVAVSSSSQFFWHVLRLPMEFFNQRWPGEISTRVQINDRVAQLLSGDLATTIINVLTIVFYAAVMLSYDVVLTLVAIGLAGVNILALRYVSRKRVDESRRLQKARGLVNGTAAGGLQMMESLKATGTEGEFFTDWSGRYATSMNAEQELGVFTVYLSSIPTPLLQGINTVLILWIGGLRVMDGHMSVGMLVAFQSLTMSFMDPVNQLVTLGSNLQEVEADMNRLDDVLRYPTDPQAESTEDDVGKGARIAQLSGQVDIRDLTFGYSRLESPLIDKFNLSIKPGSRVALVGGSGSGKSTIAKLVAGLYEPWSGEILLDGQPRRQVPRAILTNSLAMVDQEIFLLEGTIRDNLTTWDSTISAQNVVQAARDARIHDDVAVRKDGYDSIIDEGGTNFSGGQRQRLEIARALVGNPTILVLDEATSALDSNTEKEIDDALRRRGCTCIIVAHRLSTIRDADEIVVLERGQVVERGTHESLRSSGGVYARLIET
jgi:NHLM bacteriocin system ABC transporter peptidase/ATP-binding protein